MIKIKRYPFVHDGLVSIREAFILLLPVVVVLNGFLLLIGALQLLWPSLHDSSLFLKSQTYSQIILYVFPFFFLLAFSFVLATKFSVHKLSAVFISLLSFMVVTRVFSMAADGALLVEHRPSMLLMLMVTTLVIHLYRRLHEVKWLRLVADDASISPVLRASLNLIAPLFLIVLSMEGLRWILMGLEQVLVGLFSGWHLPDTLGIDERMTRLLHLWIAQCAWMLGVHGPLMAEDALGLLGAPNLTQGSTHESALFTLFASIGGSGSTLGLLLAVFWLDRHRGRQTTVTKIALPFSLFNINEVVLYGLPIVFNPIYLVPFVLIPFVNMGCGFLAVDMGWIMIQTSSISWMTPPLLNMYQATHGSWQAVWYQAGVIGLDVLLYAPFVHYNARQRMKHQSIVAWIRPDAGQYLQDAHSENSEKNFVDRQMEQQAFNRNMDELLAKLKGGDFILFFQPKRLMSDQRLVGIEVLLRLRDRHGDIHPPVFMDTLHQAGMSQILDRKVVSLTLRQIRKWEKQGRKVPVVSINLEQSYLCDRGLVGELIQQSRGLKTTLQVEVTEHEYIQKLDAMLEAVSRLRAAGIRVSIDDFGAGYSSLTSLTRLEADEVKLDREFIQSWMKRPQETTWLIESTTALCHRLGFEVVIEGVENDEQLQAMRACKIDVVQGYYTGKPMPALYVQQHFDL